MNAIELKNVTFTYSKHIPGAVPALNDVSIEVERGGITGLIGHTGSGNHVIFIK